MLELPLIDELVEEKYREVLTAKTREAAEAAREAACKTAQRDILTVLEARFGGTARELAAEIGSVVEDEQLQALMRAAASCPDLAAFRRAMGQS